MARPAAAVPDFLLLIAGPIAVGKTSVAREVARAAGGEVVAVRQALVEVLGLASNDRALLQREGADLDQRTRGRWLVDYLRERMDAGAGRIIVDSLRTIRQTEPILLEMPVARLVYLDASATIRRQRYAQAASSDAVKRSASFDQAMNHPTEQNVSELKALAQLVIDTADIDVPAIADLARAAAIRPT